MTVGSILRDAGAVYRLLFRRSVATAALVYAVIELVAVADGQLEGQAATLILGIASVVLGLAGPVLVQGALVRIVRNIHDGARPERIGALLTASRARIGSLLLAAIVYGLGIVFGLLLLVVPGLLAAARWCLMAPLIMLEGLTSGDARRRSTTIVRGNTGTVLGALIVSFLLTNSFYFAMLAAGSPDDGTFGRLLFFAWGSVTAPFSAHVLTVIYYRLVDPHRPVIHENVAAWNSLWAKR